MSNTTPAGSSEPPQINVETPPDLPIPSTQMEQHVLTNVEKRDILEDPSDREDDIPPYYNSQGETEVEDEESDAPIPGDENSDKEQSEDGDYVVNSILDVDYDEVWMHPVKLVNTLLKNAYRMETQSFWYGGRATPVNVPLGKAGVI